MTERKPCSSGPKNRCLFMMMVLAFSAASALITAPVVSAAPLPQSLGVSESISPRPDSWHSAWDSLILTVQITNHAAGGSAGLGRQLSWYACEGDLDAVTCQNNPDDSGGFTVASIAGGTSVNLTSTQSWVPGGSANGMFTIVFAFPVADQNSADDRLKVNVNVTTEFSDFIVDDEHDPLESVEHLALINGEKVLNTQTPYIITASGMVSTCGTCNLEADFGWQIWDINDSVKLREAYTTETTFISNGVFRAKEVSLPPLNFSQQGSFLLKWGVFSSSGTPQGDMNEYDNIAITHILFDDTLDLTIEDVFPSHDRTDSKFYFGTERAIGEVSNVGSRPVTSFTVYFEIYTAQFELEAADECWIDIIYPGETIQCAFDVNSTGPRLLRVRTATQFPGHDDAAPSDNALTMNAELEIGAINPQIVQPNPIGIYESSDYIELVGRFSEIASQPLNFTWREGFAPLGYGQTLNWTGEEFMLGHHIITLEVRDAFGYTEYASVEFDVLKSVSLDASPFFNGTAVTDREAYFEYEIILPSIGTNYGIGGGKSALMLVSIDVRPTDDNTDDFGLKSIDLDLNLSAILPSNIDLSTIDIRHLPQLDTNSWSYLELPETFVLSDDFQHADVYLESSGVLLITGVLPEASVEMGDIQWALLPEGGIQLEWEAFGDLSNPYIGGWNVYKLQGGATFFPDPKSNFDGWEALTSTTLQTTLPISATSWVDPIKMETGICSSYAIAPIDREGNPNFEMLNISRIEGDAGFICGDAIPPTSMVTQFSHSWRFTNSTDCFERANDWSMCYDLTLSWVWPANEPNGELSWNLYRVEAKPINVDLKYITPIAEGIHSIPGEVGMFNQSGTEVDGIRPYRTYYYILAPIDAVGNQQMLANYPSGNILRIHIDDDWWSYNQHLIPPEPEPPEPPLGVQWLGDLEDTMQRSEFQIAGLVLIGTLVLNFILLPMIVKKRKRLKRVLAARQRNATYKDDDFDDFF